MFQPAPVAVFCYKRINELQNTIAALKANALAKDTDLYIFSDGSKASDDVALISNLRKYLKTIVGFKTVNIIESPLNLGLSKSIIDGVSYVLNSYSSIIVLEDDLLVSENFLDYMNCCLTFYKDTRSVASVCAYTFPIKSFDDYDVYFTKRSSSWGWGTWKRAWNKVDWEVKDFDKFIHNKSLQKEFNKMGSDLTRMLAKQMSGQISSWAIRWSYHQFRNNLYSVHPKTSKITNEGFGKSATHTSLAHKSRFATNLDTNSNKYFNLPIEPFLDPLIVQQFVDKYSFRTRFFYKIKGIFGF